MKIELIKNTKNEDYPNWLCSPCGLTMNYLTCLDRYGEPPFKPCFDVSTFHKGYCDLCGRPTDITESRDFFYPNIYKVKKPSPN